MRIIRKVASILFLISKCPTLLQAFIMTPHHHIQQSHPPISYQHVFRYESLSYGTYLTYYTAAKYISNMIQYQISTNITAIYSTESTNPTRHCKYILNQLFVFIMLYYFSIVPLLQLIFFIRTITDNEVLI